MVCRSRLVIAVSSFHSLRLYLLEGFFTLILFSLPTQRLSKIVALAAEVLLRNKNSVLRAADSCYD